MHRRIRLRPLLAGCVLMLIPLCSWAMPDFETFFTHHSTPMWMVSVDSGEILRANLAAHEFYGFDNLEGMKVAHINMHTSEQVEQEIQQAAQAERNHLYFRHRLANGEVKVMGVYTDRFEVDGRAVLISSLYDTSNFESSAERHYIERVEEQVDLQTQQLQAARARADRLAIGASLLQFGVITVLIVILLRLRRSQRENRRLIDELSFRNKELERLSHVMAHHFQEPARRLVSFAQQLTRRLSDSEDETIHIAVGFIQTQAKRLSDLVSDVQRYLGLDSIPPAPENLDPQAILESVYQSDALLREARTADALEIPKPLPKVYVDAKQLTLIFRVLLSNAWRYRHPERALRIRVTGQRCNERVELCVEDNGSGIAPEYRQQVLDMFARLVPNTQAYPGTGMGLALIVKALRSVNGQVKVEDGLEGGTAIVFDLPAAR